MKKCIFIINPKSGNGKGKKAAEIISKYPFQNIISEIAITESGAHFKKLIQQSIDKKPDAIIAVGGDGTVNTIGNYIVNHSIILGIVPIGSGNGLARDLNIPLNIIAALKKIDQMITTQIDVCEANKKLFFCASGIGFDAHISQLFLNSTNRGLSTYLRLSIKEYINYQSKNYIIKIDGKVFKRKTFIIAVCNASQYGNNSYIAPMASMKDGLMDVVILKPFNIIQSFVLAWKLFNKKLQNSNRVEYYRGKNIVIEGDSIQQFHTDGEIHNCSEQVEYQIMPSKLTIII